MGNTFYSFFVKIFYLFYSKKYDHYKIFKNILLLDETIKKSKSIFISESSNLQLNKVVEEKTLEVQDIQVISSNKRKNTGCSSNSSNNNNDKGSEFPMTEKEDKYDENENEVNNLNLPKLPFVDFVFNNFYSGKCCTSNKHKLMTLSSKIIYRYNSIENILYNQIKFENLLNDYKWNNPKLKNVQNNKTILEMRNNLNI